MSLAMNLLELAREEAARNGCNRLIRVRVDYGALSGALPEALRFCFQTLVGETEDRDAILELREIPLRLRCPMCNAVFGGDGPGALWEPCPECGEVVGHIVEQGRELILSQIEAI